MEKTQQQSPGRAAKDLPLLTLIQEVKARAEAVKPLLETTPTSIPTAGSLDYRARVCSHVAVGLDQAAKEGRDRHTVAADMSRYMGGDMTKGRLDKLAAPSQEGYDLKAHEIPAYTLSTKDRGLISDLAHACGLYVVSGAEMALVELGRMVQASGVIDQAKAELLGRLANSQGGQS
jgi:hypothetical protein